MKHLLYLIALLPFILCAQNTNSRYLEGNVPVVGGKVVFQKEITSINNSKEKVYQTALSWAKQRFGKEGCRVVYQNSENGEIAATGNEYIVFTNNALSLDRSKLIYQVMIYCYDQTCTIKMTNIKYEYNVTYQREPEKYTAEEWITDKNALHKGKLNRITGKFRRGTIDFVDELFADAEKSIGQGNSVISQQPIQASIESKEENKADNSSIASSAPEGFTLLETNKVSETLQQMIPTSEVRLKMKNNNINESKVEWKGFGTMFNKNITYISLDKDSKFLKEDNEGDIYTLQFSSKPFDEKDVWMIIECSKQGETPDGKKQTVIGEVLRIWIK